MTPQPDETRPMSEAGRMVNVFVDPKAAFADIAAWPRPWAPLVLLIVVSIGYMAAFSHRVGWAAYMEQQGERAAQSQNMTADQRAKAAEMYTKMGGWMDKFMPAVPVVTIPLYTVVVAGVLALVFRTLMSADVTFRQLFAISAYAWLPDVLMSAAATAVLFLKSPEEFNLENPVAFNAGAFLDPESTSKAVMSLASSIDLFSFWKLVLLAVGVSVAARRMTFGSALIGVCIPWVLWVAAKTGIAALRG
jgi:hypothetical protein